MKYHNINSSFYFFSKYTYDKLPEFSDPRCNYTGAAPYNTYEDDNIKVITYSSHIADVTYKRNCTLYRGYKGDTNPYVIEQIPAGTTTRYTAFYTLDGSIIIWR